MINIIEIIKIKNKNELWWAPRTFIKYLTRPPRAPRFTSGIKDHRTAQKSPKEIELPRPGLCDVFARTRRGWDDGDDPQDVAE